MENRTLRPRVYFSPGDTVEIKQNIQNKPRMVVKSVDKVVDPTGADKSLLGVTCIWYDTNMVLHEYRYSTKDLKKLPKSHD